MEIQIRKISIDDYGYDPPHTELLISNNDFSARREEYINDSFWLNFGIELQSFPKNLKDEVVFGFGNAESDNPIFLRAFVYDGVGHSALEVKITRQSSPPYSASAHFYILCEVATLNLLGKELELWIKSAQNDFIFRTNDN
jgi:hypothetical protein